MIRNPWSGLRGLPAQIWILSGVTLVNRMGTMALPFLVLYLTEHLGYAPGVAGSALAVFGAGSLISAPLGGRLTDRVGALPVMTWSLLIAGVLLAVFPLVEHLAAVFSLVFLWAVAGEAVRPASLVALTESIPPKQRKAAIALNRLAINLGMSLGPAVGGFLAMVSFPLIFVVDGVTSLAAGVLLAAVVHRMGLRKELEQGRAEAAALAHPARVFGAAVLMDRPVRLFLVGVFLIGLVFFQHEAAMSLFLVRDLGYPESFYGFLFVVNTLIIVAAEVPLNLRMAGWPHYRALALGAALFAIGFGAMAVARSEWAIVATVIVWTVGEMIFLPSAATFVTDAAPPHLRGEYSGAYTMAYSFAFTIGPWLGTVALAQLGPVTLWGGCLVLGLAAAGLMYRLGSARPVGTLVLQSAGD